MSERWKVVPGFPSYRVSDRGRLRTLKRRGGKYGRVLDPKTTVQGYREIELWGEAGERRWWRIHQLVLLAFVGRCPEGHEVNHKNGDKADNRLENLEYVTREENWAHAMASGLEGGVGAGSENGNATLTEADVLDIRHRYAAGDASQPELGREYGVTATHIGFIVTGKNWQDAGGPITRRGKGVPGEENKNAKLTEAEVREIRRLYRETDLSYAAVGRRFGVTTSNVRLIVKRETWAHVD